MPLNLPQKELRSIGLSETQKISKDPISEGTSENSLSRQTEAASTILSILQATLDAIHDVILITDLNGSMLTTNEKFNKFFKIGIRSDQIVGQSILELSLLAKDSNQFIEVINTALDSSEDFIGEIIFADARIIEVFSKKHIDEHQQANRIWSFRDISDKKYHSEMQARLAALVESSEDAIISKTLTGVITSWNYGAEQIFGYKPEEIIGQSIYTLIPKDRVSEENYIISRLKAGERIEHFETERVRKDGSTIIVSLTVSPIKDNQGKIIGAAKIARDITKKKDADQTKSLLAAVVESTDDAVITKNLDGIIQTWNKSAERIFGYKAVEVIGKPITILFLPEKLHEEATIIRNIKEGKTFPHFETQRVTKEGTVIDVSITVSPIRDSTGKVIGASKILRDISEQKIAQEMLRKVIEERAMLLDAERAARAEAERVNVIKDEFLATLSHELRTPLNAILGWAQLLSAKKLKPEDADKGIKAIEKNARVQTQLISDLLDMSRIISGKMQIENSLVDLSTTIGEALLSIKPAAEAKSIKLSYEFIDSDLYVSGDPTRLQQVVWNLLTNAVKFTPEGGEINVTLKKHQESAQIIVKDNGIGISKDVLPHIFERFKQADSSISRASGGLGLGLSIVKNLVELHSGSITAESDLSRKGTTFTISLPLRTFEYYSDSYIEHQNRNSIDLDLSDKKILIVDDEDDAKAFLTRLLESHGASVVSASSAKEGIEKLKDELPALIISDIGMPRVDGYEFIKQVREIEKKHMKKTPAIALTAFARIEDKVQALKAGYQMHVPKPIETSELLSKIANLI